MGITAHPYDDENRDSAGVAGGHEESGHNTEGGGEGVVPSHETAAYTESENFVADPTAMTGTVDTSGVGAGPHEDVRNVTATFDAADARVASVLENDETEDNQYRDVPEEDRADAAATLRERSGTEQGETPAQVAAGDGGQVVEEERSDEGVADAQGTSGTEDAVTEQPTEGNPEEAASEQPTEEPTEEPLIEEGEKFDPDKNSVKGTKAYLDTADDEEFQRVIEAEKAGQNRPGIVNYTR